MKLGHIMIFVNDMTKARWFYSELLGLQTLLEQENKLVFALEGFQLTAFKCEKTTEMRSHLWSNLLRK
ncbi:hypothetical protein GCM10008018_44230 [Paenibacillus marchantiophytorum]|uniref:Glyoxalase/fosfomycin resistance/dioxygenase domain-containing protein n=1 Tax=Paenibacillus marchantiophytorum TaxID=1619310 RepID=A0ABQ1EY97_9BACL|nr:hypothetical protein GCM10008018_44230 [Paenibacillus marchantiophytorum]